MSTITVDLLDEITDRLNAVTQAAGISVDSAVEDALLPWLEDQEERRVGPVNLG
jgi:ribosomal protein L12E/L44/L45/RPP1/RPP2